MSRGPGRTERAVLAELERTGDFMTVCDLAAKVYEGECLTRARYESTRRAVQTLIRRGLICRKPGGYDRRRIRYDDGVQRWHSLYGTRAIAEAEMRRLDATRLKAYGPEALGTPEGALKVL